MSFARARSDPDGVALEDGTRRRSWAELADRTTRIARLLREDLGLAPGEHVALLLENRVESVELLWGAIHAGVWVTPINWHLAPDEIDYIVRNSGTRVLFTDATYEARARETGCEVVLTVGIELDGALASASDAPMPLDGPAAGNMLYTSGTTGRPKGVKRWVPKTLGDWLERGRASGSVVGLDGSGAHLVTGPCYHAAPLMFAAYDQGNGAPVVVMPRWDERQFLALVAERDIRHTHLVPTMFVRLLNLPDEERAAFDPAGLDLVLHGAAPVSRRVKERMLDWWGDVLVEYWGGTEGGVNTLIDSADWREHPGSVGRALPGFDVFAVDERGERRAPGEVGDLYCTNQKVAEPFVYHGAPEKTRAAFLSPGTFTLGDVGCVDDAGYVFLSDRATNMIISGGVNIYPAEIEHVLQEHPAVADVGVFGVPDDEWGESVKAAVELTPGHESSDELAEALRSFAREHLAGYKVPRTIDFESSLPRHASGKLYIRRLRDRYWQGRDRKI